MIYLLLAIVVLGLALNVYFRIKIIGKYKILRNKQINMEPALMFDRQKRLAFTSKYYPEYSEEIEDFSRSLNRLIIIAATGLLLILVVFIILKWL